MGKEEPLKKGEIAMPVGRMRHWMVLLLVGVAAVLLLSRLPSLDQGLQQRREAVSVFQPSKAKLLTDDNLVDSLSGLPFRDQLMKVGWDHSILTVDLLGTVPDEMWEDMGRLIVFSYSEVHNVRQVLIRVFKGRGEDRRLLLAAETRKSDWTEKELSSLQPLSLMVDPDAASKIRLSVTSSGKRWFANLAK